MGREVRKVSKDWEHPSYDLRGKKRLRPLYSWSYKESREEWVNSMQKWLDGGYKGMDVNDTHWEYHGSEPVPKNYMPEWTEEEKTHFQMYETCSEGTPISPVMETPEELAKWLAENKASSFGHNTATYDQWLNMIGEVSAPSAVMDSKGMRSGVEAASDK